MNTQTKQTIQAIIQTIIQTIQVLNTQTIQSIQFCNSCDVSKYAEGADAISRVGAHPHPSNAVRLESASFFSLLILNPKRGNRLKCEVLLVPNTFRRNFLWRNPRNWGITGGLITSKKVFHHNPWRGDSRRLLRNQSFEWSYLAIPPSTSLSFYLPSILFNLSNFLKEFL